MHVAEIEGSIKENNKAEFVSNSVTDFSMYNLNKTIVEINIFEIILLNSIQVTN